MFTHWTCVKWADIYEHWNINPIKWKKRQHWRVQGLKCRNLCVYWGKFSNVWKCAGVKKITNIMSVLTFTFFVYRLPSNSAIYHLCSHFHVHFLWLKRGCLAVQIIIFVLTLTFTFSGKRLPSNSANHHLCSHFHFFGLKRGCLATV